jgi:hypothetical protein
MKVMKKNNEKDVHFLNFSCPYRLNLSNSSIISFYCIFFVSIWIYIIINYITKDVITPLEISKTIKQKNGYIDYLEKMGLLQTGRIFYGFPLGMNGTEGDSVLS